MQEYIPNWEDFVQKSSSDTQIFLKGNKSRRKEKQNARNAARFLAFCLSEGGRLTRLRLSSDQAALLRL